MAHYYKKLENNAAIEYIKGCELDGTPIVLLKLETTGLDVKTSEICGIRAIKFTVDSKIKRIGELKELVKTYKPIPKEATNINGITNEMLEKNGVSPKEALLKLNDFIDGCILCGFNTKQFIYPILFQAMKEESIEISAIGGFDLYGLAAATILPIGYNEGYTQNDLFELFHIEDSGINALYKLFQLLKNNLPNGSADVPDTFILRSRRLKENGVNHIIFDTQSGKLDLNCWNYYFEDVTDSIFETYDINSIIRYILKKTKTNTLSEAVDVLCR